MKVALITDTHFGARNDSVAFDNFFKKFYEEVFWPEIDKRGIRTIFHLGDCFDRRKYINFNSLKSCREYFFDQAQKRKIKVVMLVGNHDTYFKNTNEVNSPHLLLKEYDNICAYSTPTEYEIDGKEILLLPWICTDNYNECMEAINNTNANVCFAHLELAGYQMWAGQESHDGFDPSLFKKFQLVCSGHFHHRQSKGNITYLGNPYEMFWQDYNDKRGFHIFDTNSLELEFVQNPFIMFSKLYYDDTKDDGYTQEDFINQHIKLIVVNKTDTYNYEKFLEKVYKSNPAEVKIIEDFSEFEAEAINDQDLDVSDTLTLLTQYVDAIEAEVDKDRLKNLMKTLYIEALDSNK